MCVHLAVIKCAPTEFTIIMYLYKKGTSTHKTLSVCVSEKTKMNENSYKRIQRRMKNEIKLATRVEFIRMRMN